MGDQHPSVEGLLDVPGTELNVLLRREPQDGVTFSEEAINQVVEQALVWIVSRIGRAVTTGPLPARTAVRVTMVGPDGRDHATLAFGWDADSICPFTLRGQYSRPAMVALMDRLHRWIMDQIAELVILDAVFPHELTITIDGRPETP